VFGRRVFYCIGLGVVSRWLRADFSLGGVPKTLVCNSHVAVWGVWKGNGRKGTVELDWKGIGMWFGYNNSLAGVTKTYGLQ